jgi:hypothetical protein
MARYTPNNRALASATYMTAERWRKRCRKIEIIVATRGFIRLFHFSSKQLSRFYRFWKRNLLPLAAWRSVQDLGQNEGNERLAICAFGFGLRIPVSSLQSTDHEGYLSRHELEPSENCAARSPQSEAVESATLRILLARGIPRIAGVWGSEKNPPR